MTSTVIPQRHDITKLTDVVVPDQGNLVQDVMFEEWNGRSKEEHCASSGSSPDRKCWDPTAGNRIEWGMTLCQLSVRNRGEGSFWSAHVRHAANWLLGSSSCKIANLWDATFQVAML